jgi:superfamily II DNA/RNA helicase
MESGADIIIATPGRLIALLQSGTIKLYDDIIRILSYLPKKRQTLLFSATMPPKIKTLAGKILNNPQEVSISIAKPAEGILQQAYLVFDSQKQQLLKHVLLEGAHNSVIIFASSKDNVKKLDRELNRAGLGTKAFHSDLEQEEREAILREFRSRQLPIIIGTDILSRGIDVEGIGLVINYDAPHDPEDYIHRIGRTARAETKGTAITFINEKDQQKFSRIERLIGKEIPKIQLPAGLGEGPLYQPELKRKSAFSSNRNPKGKSHHRKSK